MSGILGCTTRPYASIPYAEAFQRIAAAGYRDVAVFRDPSGSPVDSGSSAAAVSAVRAAAAAAGVVPSLLLGRTHLEMGLAAAVDDYRRLIDNAAALGAMRLLDCGTSRPEDYAGYLELMRRCAPHALAAGLQITMKPHGGISLTVEDLLEAHRQVGQPGFGICFDPGNIIYYTVGARRPEPDAARVAAVCNAVIIKDCVVRDGKADVMVTPGDGLVDFTAVLGGLLGQGWRGPCYVECVGSRDLPGIDRDIAFTRGYIRGILEAAVPARP